MLATRWYDHFSPPRRLREMRMKGSRLSTMKVAGAVCAAALAMPMAAHAQASDNPFPADMQHPALFLVGDSIVRTGVGDGSMGPNDPKNAGMPAK